MTELGFYYCAWCSKRREIGYIYRCKDNPNPSIVPWGNACVPDIAGVQRLEVILGNEDKDY